jgi:hypothetical protein
LTNGKEKPDAEKSPGKAATEQSKVLGVKKKTKIDVGTSSWQPQNWTIQFPKPDHPVSAASGQKKASKTTAPGTAPTPRWFTPSLIPSQRRRI